jgi:hypothetical protein
MKKQGQNITLEDRMTIKEITKFVTDDGEEFKTREEAENHERIEWLGKIILEAGLPDGGGYTEEFCKEKAAKMLLDRFLMREKRYAVNDARIFEELMNNFHLQKIVANAIALHLSQNFDIIAKP